MDEATQIEILVPTPPDAGDDTSETWSLDRSLDGVVVGLRTDHSWRSYFAVIEVWEEMLRRDGAIVRVLWAGDRVGPQGEQTRSDVEGGDPAGVECNSRGQRPRNHVKKLIVTLKGSHSASDVRPFQGRKNLTCRSGGVAAGYYIGRLQRPKPTCLRW